MNGLHPEMPQFLLALGSVHFAADKQDEVRKELAEGGRVEGDEDGQAEGDQEPAEEEGEAP